MENPMNQEDTETNTKDAVKAEEPAASNSGDRSDGTSSPPPNCSICLGKLINTSFTDSCLHQFCFTCLLQWSRIKTECPLCKQTFKSIIHNVRSEEDYDQYHVPREAHLSTQATGSFGVTLGLGNSSMNAYQRFAYRTTMTPSRRYGRLFASLHPNSNHHTRQGPPVSTSQLSAPSSQERRQRRNVYRTGEWSDPVPEVYSRFRQCSAEYYRRYPHEIDRLIPWINRDLQTIFNSNQPHIAYVLSVITDMLTQYDMRSPEFRNAIRNYFGLETEHFIHELMNYASTDLSMAAYDETVTYFNSFSSPGLMSGGYWHHVQSQTSSSTSSSTISDDSDIRVVDHVDPSGSELPSVGPHLINMPGPSTVSQAFQIQTPEARPFVLTISSSSSESECEIVGYVKPRCERTPEIIELMSSGEEEIVAACNNSLPEIESPRSSSLSPINDQPSTSESSRRLTKNSKSKANSRQLSLVSRLSDTSSGSDSEIDDTQTNKPTNRRNSKHSSTKRTTRKSSPKKNESVTKKRSKHSYSSSDSNSPRESKCRRTSLNSSRKTKACILSSESDGENQSSSRNTEEFKTTDKDENSKTTCRVRVRKDLINGSKKKHKRRNKRTSSTSSISSSTTTSSSSSESDTSNTSLDTSSTSLTNSSSYTSKVNKSRKKKRSKSKRSSKHKNYSDNLHGRHHNRSRSRSRTRSKSKSRSRSRSRELLSDDINERCYSVNEKYRERKAAKIANKKLKNKHLYAMTDSQNDTEEAYRSNSQCSSVSDRHKTSKSNDNKKYSKSDSNSKTKSHKTKSHKKSVKNLKKQKQSKTRGENEKRSRRRITSSSSSSSSLSSSSSKY